MEYFLENIARSLYSEFGNTLNKHCLVFPNRRAGLYFLKYMAAIIKKPVWVPSISTINELFRSYSSLQIAGNEILLFELYKIYIKLKKTPESFDDFYFWGDMLVNDFDDVDKYMVDARLLFCNVLDIKNIDEQFGGLTEAQIEIVKKFWINFDSDKPTREKTGFINIWSVLNDLYTGFRSSLKEKNIAYEGMIFRDLAEQITGNDSVDIQWEMVHFIGFNALNECEKIVMKKFRDAGKARFYWDYDNSFLKREKLNSAGHFLRENLKLFGNNMSPEWNYDTMLSAGVPAARRRVIETSSDVAQVKLIARLIEDLPDLTPENAHHTAVVLADENLLMPVLTSLPENAGNINITMGYPLRQTLIYTLLKHLMDLQRNAVVTEGIVRFSFKDVISILKHTLISRLMNDDDAGIIDEITKTNMIRVPSDRFAGSAYLKRVFVRPETSAGLSDYFKEILSIIASKGEDAPEKPEKNPVAHNIRNEFIYRMVLSINRLETIVNSSEVYISPDTYMKILDRMLRIQSVPFSGEPLLGVQIMGILETRALDFKNLIILSVNEGILPAVSSGSSFIPFSLREAFCLPSVNYQESIYAYHFYRLLQRAENVTFTYNSNSEGLTSGEMSRFLIQMKYDAILKPDFLNLQFEIKTHQTIGDRIEKTEEHVKRLSSLYLNKENARILSPSAINAWLNCRMKFYYRYVNGLKETEVVTKDIEPAMLGNILHEIMKSLYQESVGQVLSREKLDIILKNRELLERITQNTINEIFKNGTESSAEGSELIIREVLMVYVSRILNFDRSVSPVTILGLEETHSFVLPVSLNGIEINVTTGGKADRIDRVEDVTRIVDYKTGTVADRICSIDDLFSPERKKDTDGWLQTLLYCEAYLASHKDATVRPSVYKIKKLSADSLSDKLLIKMKGMSEQVIDDYQVVRNDFIINLKQTISDILRTEEPFIMTTDVRGKCSYCAYKELCNR